MVIFYNYFSEMKNMKIIASFVFLLFSTFIFGNDVDSTDTSFFGRLDNIKAPDEKAFLLLNEAENYIHKDSRKAYYYLEKALAIEDQIHDTSLIRLYSIAGQVYFDQNSYQIALGFFQKQLELQNKVDSSASHFIYNSLGNIYFRLEDYAKAGYYYNKDLEKLQKTGFDSGIEAKANDYSVYNNLAVLERRNENYLKALDLLNDFASIAMKYKDTAKLITAYHNFSNVYSDLKDYDKSLQYLNDAIKLSTLTNSTRDLAFLFINKGVYYFKEKPNLDSAQIYFTKSFELSERYNYVYTKMQAAKNLVDIYEYIKDYKNANHFLHLNEVLTEEMLNEKNSKEITRIEMEFKFEKQLQENIMKQKKKDRLYLIGAIFSFLIILILFLLFRLQKGISSKKKMENELLEGQLITKNKEMTSNVMHLLQVTELTNNTSQKLIALRKNADKVLYSELTDIIRDLQHDKHGLNWQEFEKLFIETHNGFYKKLLMDFPALTQNEIRLSAFIKMNMSTKEISAITRQSVNSITVARSRLRKKLNIDGDDLSLISFLSNY